MRGCRRRPVPRRSRRRHPASPTSPFSKRRRTPRSRRRSAASGRGSSASARTRTKRAKASKTSRRRRRIRKAPASRVIRSRNTRGHAFPGRHRSSPARAAAVQIRSRGHAAAEPSVRGSGRRRQAADGGCDGAGRMVPAARREPTAVGCDPWRDAASVNEGCQPVTRQGSRPQLATGRPPRIGGKAASLSGTETVDLRSPRSPLDRPRGRSMGDREAARLPCGLAEPGLARGRGLFDRTADHNIFSPAWKLRLTLPDSAYLTRRFFSKNRRAAARASLCYTDILCR